ncbi:MAG TPA: ATPase domain-containing protein, partial [Burkholderiaceae bacterium]
HSMDSHLCTLYGLHERHHVLHIAVDGLPQGRLDGQLCINFAEQLLHHAREHGATLLVTSAAPGSMAAGRSHAPAMASVADVWLDLSYAIAGGRRYRELAIVKARGTAHEHDIHELVLGDSGIALSPLDVLAATGGMA